MPGRVVEQTKSSRSIDMSLDLRCASGSAERKAAGTSPQRKPHLGNPALARAKTVRARSFRSSGARCIRKPPFASVVQRGTVSGSRFAPRSFIGAERVCSSYKLGPPVTEPH